MRILPAWRAELGRRPFLSLGHWFAFFLLGSSVWSGLNLAIDQRPWLQAYLSWWPGMQAVPMWHSFAAVGWLVLCSAYLIYRFLLLPHPANSPTPASHRKSRRQIYFALSLLIASGTPLLFNFAGAYLPLVRTIHLASAAILLLVLLWHLWVEWQIGAWGRIANLLFKISLRKKNSIFVSLVLLATVSVIGGSGLHYWQSSHIVFVPRIKGEMSIDGDATEPQWKAAHSTIINTYFGAPYTRSVPVEIKMVNDGYSLYIHARWPDPTLSREHLPLLKTKDGWRVKQERLLVADELRYYEDKFAVMIASKPWDALRSVFLSQKEGRGGHFMPKNELVDIWHWKSLRNHAFANLDDAHFGALLPAIPGQRRYTWGYASDPIIAGGYVENWDYFLTGTVNPIRLPRKPEALAPFQKANITSAQQDPVMGLFWSETQPYHASLDTYPLGTVLPSVVWVHANEGDRADVRAAGVWRDGYWHLEMARNFETDSAYDKTIEDGVFLWFSTFDHSQIRHTYHLRPLRLKLER